MARILIIDDEVYIRKIIEYNLKKEGHDIVLCENADEAEYLIEKGEVFDLIITDLMMPVTTGLDFLRKIRKKYKLDSQKVMMISAKGMEKDIDEANLYKVNGYVMKPFNLEQLKKDIKTVLQGNNLEN